MSGGGAHETFQGVKWQSIPLGVSYFPEEVTQQPKQYVSGPKARVAVDH